MRRDVPETVIAGREVSFGLDYVDDDMQAPRFEVVSKPDGAEVDMRTLTVRWRVPAGMTGPQHFVLRFPPVGEAHAAPIDSTLTVNVVAAPPTAGQPDIAPPLVAALVTITSRDFLARTAHDWPIERVLEVSRDAAIDALPAAQQAQIDRRSGADLFRELLTAYAQQHQNPRLDPASPQFDARFASSHWRLIAVRPRVNKHIEELRLAYQAVDVPEPVFAMFRIRLFRGANSPSAAVTEANNLAFTRLVHTAFFNGARLKPGIAEGRAPAVSAAVASLVQSVMRFRDPHDPMLRVGLVAIPEEARMGGGSRFDAQGNYESGNGWAFTVANLKIDDPPAAASAASALSATPTTTAPARRGIHVVNVPVSAFTFDIAPNTAGDAFTSVCPPRYREGGEGNEAGLTAMCESDGTVRIREHNLAGAWVKTRRDSMGEHSDVTHGEMLATVRLEDPRRRNFEENGMTCVQCHIRNFDDGVLSEAQVSDPRIHTAITPASTVARVALTILPVGSVTRSPWLRQQETFQVCDLGRHIRAQLHANVDLPCPEGY